jgi:hypothetical protein
LKRGPVGYGIHGMTTWQKQHDEHRQNCKNIHFFSPALAGLPPNEKPDGVFEPGCILGVQKASNISKNINFSTKNRKFAFGIFIYDATSASIFKIKISHFWHQNFSKFLRLYT